jgi:hypothetical protein
MKDGPAPASESRPVTGEGPKRGKRGPPASVNGKLVERVLAVNI